MPIYEYKCSKCAYQFELIQHHKAGEEQVICPLCGDGHAEKLISAFSCGGNKDSSSNYASRCSSSPSRFT